MSAIATKLMTFEEYAPIYGDLPYELVKGIPTEIPFGRTAHSGWVLVNFMSALMEYVREHDSGLISGGDNYVIIRRNPDTVLGADISFYSYSSFPENMETGDPAWNYAIPELIAEVIPTEDRQSEFEGKPEEYLQAGVRIVLVINPYTDMLTLYRKNEIPQVFDNGDTLTLPDLLPGLEIPVKSLFE